jgi:predicted DNA-binding protein with PD1-like motif
MISTESRRGRRILCRLDRGTDLFEGIRAVCQRYQVISGEVRALGMLELVELAVFDQSERRWRPSRVLTGSLDLVCLQGTVSEERGATSIQASAMVSRERDLGIEVVGGTVKRAVAYSVELVVESFDDVILRRQLDGASGLSRWHEAISEADTDPAPVAAPRPIPKPIPLPSPPVPSTNPPQAGPPKGATPIAAPPRTVNIPGTSTSTSTSAPTPTPAPTWADVAAAAKPAAPAEEEVHLNAGDVILHPRFQRCVVHRVEGNGEFIQVQLKNGRVVRLSLDVLRLTPQGIENGQRVFAVTVL